MEGSNRKIQVALKVRSNLWKFIDGLKEIDFQANLDERQIDGGEDIALQKGHYRKKEASLQKMKGMYQAGQYDSDLACVNTVSKMKINI